MPLTDRQARAFVERALRWIETIERLNDFDRFRQSTTQQDDVHLLMLALEHLANCTAALRGHVGSDTLDRLTAEFTTAWGQVSDIRDMLEHEEEYIVGPGKFPDRVHPQWGDAGYPSSYIAYSDGFISLAVVGRNYHVIKPIETAVSLKGELEKVI